MMTEMQDHTIDGPIVAITNVGELCCAIAAAMAARGFRVAAYHSGLELARAEALVNALGRDRVYAHAIDHAGWETLYDAIAGTVSAFGAAPHHAVIHVDGFDGGTGPLFVGGPDDGGSFHRTITTNVVRVYHAFRALLPSMVARNDGSIVMIGSRHGERSRDSGGAAVYGAAKAAAFALARTAAAEVRASGVRVNSLSISVPAEVDAASMLPNLAASRWVPLDSIASVAAFLLSDDARDVTGSTIPMYGSV